MVSFFLLEHTAHTSALLFVELFLHLLSGKSFHTIPHLILNIFVLFFFEKSFQTINDEKLLPSCIGLYGDWGSGKSSLMHMCMKKLKEQKDDTVCLLFNGWLYESYDASSSNSPKTFFDFFITDFIVKLAIEPIPPVSAKSIPNSFCNWR